MTEMIQPVTVFDLQGFEMPSSEQELESVLQRRTNGANHFEISAAPPAYPLLTWMINGDLSVLHYFADPTDPGSQSQGNLHAAPPVAEFPDASGGVVTLGGDSIVDSITAGRCVLQFTQQWCRPTVVGWRQL